MKISLWAFAVTILATSANGHAQLIDVNFTRGETYSGAAAVGSSGDIWNNLALYDSTETNSTFALENVAGTGVSTTLTISGFSGGVLSYGNYGNPDDTIAPNLFQGYLYGGTGTYVDTDPTNKTYGHATSTFAFANLAADTKYSVNLYDVNSAAFEGRDITATVNGVTETLDFVPNYTAFQSTKLSAGLYSGNYITVTGTSDASGNLSIDVANAPGASPEYDITALQIQAAPEPSSAALIVPGLGALLGVVAYKRRQQLGA